MPYGSVGNVPDLTALPTVTPALLIADVAITPINTFVDVMTFGTVQPGLYIVSGFITVSQATGAAVCTMKVIQGAVVLAATELLNAVGVSSYVIPPTAFNLLVAAVVKIQMASTVLTSTAKSIITNNGTATQNFASGASLIRLS